MPHQNQQGPQPSPSPKLILFLPRCSRGCGRTGRSAEMAAKRFRLGNELNPSQDAHPMQRPAIKSRHRVEEWALAEVQSDNSVAVLPKCRPISGGTKRRGLRWRRSSPQARGPKKDAGPLSENTADSSSTSLLLHLVVKFLQPLLLCNEKSAHSYILTTSTSYDFSSLTPFPPLCRRLCAPFETSNIRLDLAGGPSSLVSMRPGP